jgi:parallel beta-helix repeat protein
MFGRTVSAIIIAMLLMSMLTLAFNIQPVKASETVYIRADGSIDPPTANIATFDNVTYTLTSNINDSIVVERDNIVVDGAGYTVAGSGSGNGTTLTDRRNVTVRNMTIRNFAYGIWVGYSSNNTFSGNNVTNTYEGISLGGFGGSSNNTLSDNKVMANYGNGWGYYYGVYGITLRVSSNNTLSGNVMEGQRISFEVVGSTLSHYLHSVDTSNLADGKPVYYFTNQSDIVVNAEAYPEVGYLGFVNCANVTVQGLNLTNTGQGLLFAFTNDSRIIGNNVANNIQGICLRYASGNTFSGNNVTANLNFGISLYESSNNSLWGNNVTASMDYGILLRHSSGNTLSGNCVANNTWGISPVGFNNSIFHNSFVNNRKQVDYSFGNTAWDDGYPSGGNYWSNYVGVDVKSGSNQDQPGSDCIGDAPYVIDVNNRDHYPLMNPYGAPPLPTYSLTITATVCGTTDPAPGTYAYTVNSTVQVTAIPEASYQFDYWERDSINAGSANPYTVLMDKNYSLKALFSLAIDFDPNTLNLKSRGEWVTAYIEFPEGYNVSDIDVSTIRLNGTIPAEVQPTAIGDYDNDTVLDLMVNFNRTMVSEFILSQGIMTGNVTLTVTGNLEDGTLFQGGDIIRVRMPGDINRDGKVDIKDVAIAAMAFGSYPGHPRWNSIADENEDGKIDMRDIAVICRNFGEIYK